jgi:hypothetical protein
MHGIVESRRFAMSSLARVRVLVVVVSRHGVSPSGQRRRMPLTAKARPTHSSSPVRAENQVKRRMKAALAMLEATNGRACNQWLQARLQGARCAPASVG